MTERPTPKIVDFRTGRPFDLSRSFLIAEGSPILPRDFRQAASTPEELHHLAVSQEESFLADAMVVARQFRMQVEYPGLKTLGRIAQKAEAEKHGRVDEIFDPLRISLIASRPSQIKKALDFYSPARNSRTMELLDQFAVPDPESGMRRAKIILATRDRSLYTEIQIVSKQMMDAFDQSHKPYERQRNLKAGLCNGVSSLPHTAYRHIDLMQQMLKTTRIHIHEDAAEAAGLNKLVEKRVFGRVGDIPFVAIERGVDHCPNVIRPDALTGVYVTDNALYSDFTDGRYVPTTREQFLRASFDIALAGQSSSASKEHSHGAHGTHQELHNL